MNNIKNIFLTGLLAFVVCGFTACSSDDEPAVQPVLEVLSADAYDISDLDNSDYIVTSMTFSTNSSWQLSADKIWVLFSSAQDGAFYNELRGGAGTHKVYMKITNDARTFDGAAAMVAFAYGDKTYEYGRIYRHPLKEQSNLTDENGEVITAIEMNNSSSTTINIDANYSYGIKSYPSWMSEPQLLDGSYYLSIIDEYVPFAMDGEFVVASYDGTVEQAYPVTYAGMSPEKVEITGDNTPWGWEVSLDGKSFRSSSTSVEGDSDETIIENSMSYSVRCFNYDYTLLFATEDKDGAIALDDNGWLVGERSASDASAVTVTVKSFAPTSSARQRKGYLFAVPTGVKDAFVDEINNAEDANTFIDLHLDNVLIEVTQKDLYAATGFDIVTKTGEKVECNALTGEEYDKVSSEFGVDEVYTITGTPGVTYEVNTLYTDYDWNGGGFVICAEYRLNVYGNVGDTELAKDYPEFSGRRWGNPSKKMNGEGYYIISFKVPDAGIDKPFYVRLFNKDTTNKKVLVIMPNN